MAELSGSKTVGSQRLRMRPKFVIELGAAKTSFLDALRELLEEEDTSIVGQVVEGHAYLLISEERRSLLSPILNLHLKEGERGLEVHGEFSPHPNVWTGFMALFGVIGMKGLGGLIYGLAQMTVHQRPWALVAAPVSIALIAFVVSSSALAPLPRMVVGIKIPSSVPESQAVRIQNTSATTIWAGKRMLAGTSEPARPGGI